MEIVNYIIVKLGWECNCCYNGSDGDGLFYSSVSFLSMCVLLFYSRLCCHWMCLTYSRLCFLPRCFALWHPLTYLVYSSLCCPCTVRTVATHLRRGEHIPKMQKCIGRKSTLRMLRQPRSKYGGGGVLDAVPCRVAQRSARCWVLHNCLKFTLDRIRWIRLRQRQNLQDGLKPTSFRSLICYSTNCTANFIALLNLLKGKV